MFIQNSLICKLIQSYMLVSVQSGHSIQYMVFLLKFTFCSKMLILLDYFCPKHSQRYFMSSPHQILLSLILISSIHPLQYFSLQSMQIILHPHPQNFVLKMLLIALMPFLPPGWNSQ